MNIKVASIYLVILFTFAGAIGGEWGEPIEYQIFEFSDIRHIPNHEEVSSSKIDYYKINKYPELRFNHRIKSVVNSSSGDLSKVVTVGFKPKGTLELRNPFRQRDVTVKELSLFLSSEHNLADFKELLGGVLGDHGLTYNCSWRLWLRSEIDSPSSIPVIINGSFKKPSSSAEGEFSVDSYPCLYSTMIVGELQRE